MNDKNSVLDSMRDSSWRSLAFLATRRYQIMTSREG